jgi:hypothetical protein
MCHRRPSRFARRFRWSRFGVVWFVLALVPSTLIPVRGAMAEKRVYVAAAGLLLAAGSALAEPLATRRSARAVAAVAVVVLLALT